MPEADERYVQGEDRREWRDNFSNAINDDSYITQNINTPLNIATADLFLP